MGTKIKLAEGEFELPGDYKSLDEFVQAFTQLNGQLPTLQQQAALAEKFSKWGDPDTLEARLQNHINQQIEQVKQAALAAGATKKEANAAGNEIFERWAELSPQQQMAYMQEQIAAGVSQKVTEQVNAYWAEAQKQLGTATTGTQQQFDLLARALDAKLANPKLDLTKVWSTMSDLAKATPEKLMELAMKASTQDDDWNTKLSAEKAKWQEESDKAQAAEKLKVLNSDSLNRTFKREEDRPSLNKPGGEEAMKRSILEKALSNGDITPGQI